jgi:hypothetical protein
MLVVKLPDVRECVLFMELLMNGYVCKMPASNNGLCEYIRCI